MCMTYKAVMYCLFQLVFSTSTYANGYVRPYWYQNDHYNMEFLKEVDFDQKIHEVTIMVNLSKILKSDLCFCLKDKPRSREFFFDKTTIFCSIFVRKKKIQKSCWSIRL